jgi:arginine-tRNA-protein transferase
LIASQPPELVVHDDPAPCPYLPGKTSRLPLRLPVRALTRKELDQRLVAGDRRQGLLLYRPDCPECAACEPIRVDVARFRPGRTQRRIFARAEEVIDVRLGPAQTSDEYVELYNEHKQSRGLATGETPIDSDGYRSFLADSCCETFELRYFLGGRLLGIAITDRSRDSLSAVYCYFDPKHEKLSPGTYSILKQVELCRRWKLRYLYLGLYIANCRAMSYKDRFLPHERFIAGRWQRFERL